MKIEIKYIKIKSLQTHGLNAKYIDIDAAKCRGLKQLHLTGLPDPWLRESKEKICQIVNSFVKWSSVERILINLVPPEITKSGAHLEVPIALAAILLCTEESLSDDTLQKLNEFSFVGAINLDGSLVATAKSDLLESSQEKVIGPKTFTNMDTLLDWLFYDIEEKIDDDQVLEFKCTEAPHVEERYLERLLISAAISSRTHTLMMGPPGVGKSHLAKWMAGMNPPQREHLNEIKQIWSLAKLEAPSSNPLVLPQSRSHLSEFTGTISGKTSIPGHYALAHKGTLVIDEFTEFSRDCREILRFILDEKKFIRSTNRGAIYWPADFLLVATSNPCACGYSMGEDLSKCKCNEQSRRSYRARLSGPIWDRFGLKLFFSHKNLDSSFIDKSTKQFLDSSQENIFNCIEETRKNALELSQKAFSEIQKTSYLSKTSFRKQKLSSAFISHLCCIDKSLNLSEWTAFLDLFMQQESGWH